MLWPFGSRRVGGDGANVLRDGRTVLLALYKYDTCVFCYRVYRAIDRLKVDVEYRDVRAEPAWRKDLIANTGMSQVPCLKIDERYLHESLDIVEWLDEHFRA